MVAITSLEGKFKGVLALFIPSLSPRREKKKNNAGSRKMILRVFMSIVLDDVLF
jgi:hypothetical protein